MINSLILSSNGKIYKSYPESRFDLLSDNLKKKLSSNNKKQIKNLIDKVYREGFTDANI